MANAVDMIAIALKIFALNFVLRKGGKTTYSQIVFGEASSFCALF